MRTQALGMDHFDVPVSETLTSQHLGMLGGRVSSVGNSYVNTESTLSIEYIPLSRLAVWLREPDQLLVRVKANRKLKSNCGSRIRGK